MKGYAVNGRYKQKDSYDIYYCVRNYPGGIARLSEDCRPLLEHRSGAQGYGFVNEKFDTLDGFGPTCVRRFVEESKILGGPDSGAMAARRVWSSRRVASGTWSEKIVTFSSEIPALDGLRDLTECALEVGGPKGGVSIERTVNALI